MLFRQFILYVQRIDSGSKYIVWQNKMKIEVLSRARILVLQLLTISDLCFTKWVLIDETLSHTGFNQQLFFLIKQTEKRKQSDFFFKKEHLPGC